MILIGLGGNLPSPVGSAAATLRAALQTFPEEKCFVKKVSPFFHAAPVPASSQPWFINAVAEIETELTPQKILEALLRIERKFGRVRDGHTEKNAARTLDLDLLDVDGKIFSEGGLELPHPRLHERAFVLAPLALLAPHWVHPVSKKNVKALLADLPAGQNIARLPDAL